MDPVRIDRTHVLVLNYNGGALLRECLPSIARAAAGAGVPCPVTVVDNGSTDDSMTYLAREWPGVHILRCDNEGLASFNRVLAELDEPAVLLLNNDVKLAPDAVERLAAALEGDDQALFTAPQCWTFDGQTYEGMRTRVRMHFGMIQGLCRVPGFDSALESPGLTASAGPVLMVDRRKFLALGGYDDLYLPGRLEDLDLGFGGWLRGWKGLYVPDARALHKGMGSFEPAFGVERCGRLAARNTLLFAWKNIRGRALLSHLGWLPVRLCWSILARRPAFVLAFAEAVMRLPRALRARRRLAAAGLAWSERQAAFFAELGF